MKAKNINLTTLEEFKEKNYGKRGTKERDELEAGYEAFKIGALIHDTRVEMGMTQDSLQKKLELQNPTFQKSRTTLRKLEFQHSKKS